MLRLLDAVIGIVALLLMYLPLVTPLGEAGDWSLYGYWVGVTVAYSAYAIVRLRRGW